VDWEEVDAVEEENVELCYSLEFLEGLCGGEREDSGVLRIGGF
jgi:hypothetical protein